MGVNRLISSLVDNGIEPGSNVYGELGSTWWYLMRTPTQAAHVLGKLLTYLGEDRILWGTDSIVYGSPQDQIEAMRAFEITPSFRDRYQYPKLTPYVKRKIFGLNAADLYGVEPVRRWWSFDRDDIRDLRRTFPDGNKPWGPATMEEFRRFHEYHQGWA